MTLLERYIFKRAFTTAAGALVSLVLIVWIVQALSRIDIVKTSASAAGNIFWIALMLLPNLFGGVVPFAIMIGAIQALNALNSDSERAVISASGASPAVVTKPILLLGCIGGALMLLISHVVGPAASSAFQGGIRSINADTITLFLQPGRFEQVQPGLVLSIESVNGSTVQGLVIGDTRDPETDLTYFAREAKIVDQDGESLLLLYDGQLHRRSVKDGAVSVIEFQTYAFDLAALRPATGSDWIRASERGTGELLDPRQPDLRSAREKLSATGELADRFTSWLYAIAFSLWAVVVAGHPSTNRQGTGPAMALGLIGSLGLKAMGFVALSQIGANPIWILFCFALPLGAIAFDAVLIWRNFDLTRWSPIERGLRALWAAAAWIAGFFVTREGSGSEQRR